MADDLAAEVEAQAGGWLARRAFTAAGGEAVEEFFARGLVEADTLVGDVDQGLAIALVAVDLNGGVRVGELDRVPDEVLQDLSEEFGLHFYTARVVEISGERNVLLVGHRRQGVDGVLYEFL